MFPLLPPLRTDWRRPLRRLLLSLFLLGVVGTVAELFLIGHFEEFWQWLPMVLLTLSVVPLVWRSFSNSQVPVRLFQAMMIFFVVSGGIGLWQHYQANIEFELELYPSLSGLALFWKAIQGTSPPTLAPGWMIELGLLGIASTLIPRENSLESGE